MIKVKDESGRVLDGVYKDTIGTIVIKNDSAYIKYKHEQQRAQEIQDLKRDVSEMKENINMILSILMKDKNG